MKKFITVSLNKEELSIFLDSSIKGFDTQLLSILENIDRRSTIISCEMDESVAKATIIAGSLGEFESIISQLKSRSEIEKFES